MLRLALFAVLASSLVRASQPAACESGECKAEVSDDPSLLQLGNLGARAFRFGNTGHTEGKNSTPYLGPPLGPDGKPGPAPEMKPLIIDEDGVNNSYYLPGAEIIDDGMTVKFLPPYRFYLMNKPTTDYSKSDNFFKPIFPGKTFTVDMDFRKDGPGCGCNLNFYLVDMPAKEGAGTEGDYYCDAQCFQGKGCCPEFDMNEGNKEVQQITNHACTGKGSYADMGQPDWACQKWGDPELKTHPSDFGPGSQHTINSNEPFTYSQKFDINGGDFIFTTTMSQPGREKVMTMGPGNAQLNDMLKDLEKGMAFVTGYWFAQDMNWLDGDECGQGTEHCNSNPAYISNWRITSNGAPVPTPAAPPGPVEPPAPSEGGRCCWGSGCTGCEPDAAAWCNKDSATCTGCSGSWCA